MNEQQIAAVLEHQGIPAKRITRKSGACSEDRECETIINVTTGDGALTISLSPASPEHDKPATVNEISYIFRGWTVGEPRAIAESVLEHFGRPTTTDAMIWCQRPSADLQCPARQPTLRFVPDKLLLVLSAGGVRK
jgi:hypothetical protein